MFLSGSNFNMSTLSNNMYYLLLNKEHLIRLYRRIMIFEVERGILYLVKKNIDCNAYFTSLGNLSISQLNNIQLLYKKQLFFVDIFFYLTPKLSLDLNFYSYMPFFIYNFSIYSSQIIYIANIHIIKIS